MMFQLQFLESVAGVKSFIYKLTCTLTGMSYIGFTTKPTIRFKQHARLMTPSDPKTALRCAINELGWEAFDKEIIYCSNDAAHCGQVMEPYFITQYGTLHPNGYNQTTGGIRPHKKIVSDETRKRLSSALRGRKFSPEQRAACSERMKKRGVPKELIDRLHASNVGKKRTQETREKMRLATLKEKPNSARLRMIDSAKKYIIINPNGERQHIHGLGKWEISVGVGRNIFSRQARLRPGVPFKKGKWIGWSILPVKDEFPAGQIAQRLGCVESVEVHIRG